MKVAVVLADGFEEIEALSVVDILRRAEIDARMVSIADVADGADIKVRGTHGISVIADDKIANISDYDAIVLPGGLPGADNLMACDALISAIQNFARAGKIVAAICAAPQVLGRAGVINGAFTCYPGWQSRVASAGYTDAARVVRSGNIITSQGPATAMEFALELVKEFAGEEKYSQIKAGLLA